MAEGGCNNEAKTNGDNPLSKNSLEMNECLGNWLTYLQMLNGLCSAGTKLAQSLKILLSNHEAILDCRLTGQCLLGWEELTRATSIASNTVKHHVVTALRDHETRDNDSEKHDILRDNLLTFINLQYQFCVACCQCLGGMAECSCGKTECDIAALQQCFERLYCSTTPGAVSSSSIHQQQSCHRSPLQYPLFPLQVQRRWSETAAAEIAAEINENTMRRWSMPWDCRHVTEWPRQQQDEKTKLKVPYNDRSRSTTPDSVWKSTGMASQDGLEEAIQLLSCRPGIRPSHQNSSFMNQYVPGVTLTTCNLESNYDGTIWLNSSKIGFGSSDHSDQSGYRDSDHSGQSEHSGGSGNGHRDSKDSIHSHSDHGSHREIETTGANDVPSRKSSSSNESCLSGNSRSGSDSAGPGDTSRSQLYSMWSGGDLPFIKLPESHENQDDRPPTN
ncbi:hypothetical protein HCN44_000991 [Aphidius gifuensis]|uniref:DUF4745 domain-containing protein n=1 Tax=Aphidius gifuensis TaxID=684658 RepID=A0A834XLE0_APHGI|nr:uncharacterized protein LOC122856832 [Aphidius gifuensis]KAF7988418.1 hypothetical protein HCN44_000991 [Aphidius gifuensis]